MNPRGVLYVYWGDLDEEVERSVESIKKYNLPWHIVKIDSREATRASKSLMYQYSPFDETLFLDTDTIVLSDISYGFEMAKRHGLAMTIAPGCFASRFTDDVHPDLTEYNTGVIFWNKSTRIERLFNRWKELAPNYEIADQTSFAKAVYDVGINPYVLPANWNLRAHLTPQLVFGPIKIWHTRSPIPNNIYEWNNKHKMEFGFIDHNVQLIDKKDFKAEVPFRMKILSLFNRLKL